MHKFINRKTKKHVKFVPGRDISIAKRPLPRGRPEIPFDAGMAKIQIETLLNDLPTLASAEITCRGNALDIVFSSVEEAEAAKPLIESILADVGISLVGNKIIVL